MVSQTFDIEVFQHRLQQRRLELRLTQEALAEKLGVRQGWISRMENRLTNYVRSDNLFSLCQVLDVSADYLLGLDDVPQRQPLTHCLSSPAAEEGETSLKGTLP